MPSKEVRMRPSPTQSATLYTVGTKKTGNDGNTWIISQNINGTKRWKLYKKVSKKESKKVSKKKIKSLYNFGFTPVFEKKLDKIMELHNKVVYDKIKNNIIPELNKLDIKTYIIPQPLSKNGHYFTDYASEYIQEVYNKDIIERLNIKDVYFLFYLTHDGKKLNKNEILVNYTPFGNKKKEVIEIFKKYLGNKFDWNGSNTKAIVIKL